MHAYKLGTKSGAAMQVHSSRNPGRTDPVLDDVARAVALVVDGAPDLGICTIDALGNVQDWSPGLSRLLGWTADEMRGRRLLCRDATGRGDPAMIDQLLQTTATETVGRMDTVLERREGGPVQARLIATPAAADTGEPPLYRLLVEDRTCVHRLEAALAAAQFENAELDQRRDQFLAMLAHELRNPLSPALYALHLLGHAELDSRSEAARDVLERQVRTMSRLISDLLDVSRITRGLVKLQLGAVDLGTISAQAAAGVQPAATRRRQKLSVSTADRVLVQGDATRLEQVITNLLDNAVKYTPECGEIRVTVRRHGHEAVLRVKDTGVGMSASLVPRVFDLFTQADRSLDRAEGGLGIGLTLVRALVELHGGTASAASDGPGAGSEFTVRLPLLGAESAQIAAGSDERLPLRALRLLIVDDNVDAAQSLACLLGLHGHVVQTAYDGPTALAALKSFRPEVIILDIGLPGMSGYDVATALRQDSSEAPVLVALTGYGQPEDRLRALAAGFQEHLVKPVNPRELEETIDQLVRMDRASRAAGQ